jgi:hypothetical protein
VATGSGHSALTRMPRGANSIAQERAKLRMAALVAAYTPTPGRPLMPATDDSRTIDAPSCRSGSAFCTGVTGQPDAGEVAAGFEVAHTPGWHVGQR